MAIKLKNGTELTNVKLKNGTQIERVITRAGVVLWENWVYKTGNLYVMTSNTTPIPFVCSADIYNSDAYKVWDNNIGTYWQHPNGSSWNQIMFNKDIKVVTVSAPKGQHYPLQYMNESGQWVTFHAGGFEAYSWNLGGVICKGLRLQTSGHSIQVTEWYQKGVVGENWVYKTGELATSPAFNGNGAEREIDLGGVIRNPKFQVKLQGNNTSPWFNTMQLIINGYTGGAWERIGTFDVQIIADNRWYDVNGTITNTSNKEYTKIRYTLANPTGGQISTTNYTRIIEWEQKGA